MKKWIFAILILVFVLSSFDFAFSQTDKIQIYFFYGETCPHCKKAEEFLKTLEEEYPQLQIKSFEVFGNKENAQLLLKFMEACGEEKQVRVPAIFIGEEVIIGYFSDEITGSQIEDVINQCLEKECLDPLERLEECEVCECEGEVCECKTCECEPRKEDQIISLPIIGKIDLSKMSLPVLALTLGALDGLNPCAMWILLFLITLLLNTRSRKRMWLVGGTFVLASGLVYFLLLTAWLNLFLAISYVNLTRTLIGIFALGIGIWQIKSFIQYKPGVCPVTNGKSRLKDRIKNGLRNHVEKIALSPLTFGILIGIIILAFGVNLVEFFCSAGLPAIFTRILALSQLSSLTYYFYLLLYTFVFMLDDLIVLSIAVITLSKIGFTEKYNYWATLIGGLLIFGLGILLIFKPEFLMFG